MGHDPGTVLPLAGPNGQAKGPAQGHGDAGPLVNRRGLLGLGHCCCGHCRRLDAKTGKELSSFETPRLGKAAQPCWMRVFVKDDLLFGTIEGPLIEKGHPRPGARQIAKCMWVGGLSRTQEATHLFAMDRRSGKVKWTYEARALIVPNSVAFGNGRLFLIDRPILKPGEDRGRHPTARLVALEAATGKVLWTHDQNVFGSMLAVSEKHDVVLMGSDVKERGTLF